MRKAHWNGVYMEELGEVKGRGFLKPECGLDPAAMCQENSGTLLNSSVSFKSIHNPASHSYPFFLNI